MTPAADARRMLLTARVLPVLVPHDVDTAMRLANILCANGFASVEVALRNDVAIEVITALRERTGLLIGAGTVRSAAQAEAALAAGAHFLVSPGFDAGAAATASTAQVLLVPGVASPTEAMHAQSQGHDLLKVYPAATLGGPAFLRALTDVLGDVQFMPSGGVGLDNLPEYLSVPGVGVVSGSWLWPGRADAVDLQDVERSCRTTTAILDRLAESAHAV